MLFVSCLALLCLECGWAGSGAYAEMLMMCYIVKSACLQSCTEFGSNQQTPRQWPNVLCHNPWHWRLQDLDKALTYLTSSDKVAWTYLWYWYWDLMQSGMWQLLHVILFFSINWSRCRHQVSSCMPVRSPQLKVWEWHVPHKAVSQH